MPQEIAIIPMIGMMFLMVAIGYQVRSYNRFRGLKSRDALVQISQLSVKACERYVLSALAYATTAVVYWNHDLMATVTGSTVCSASVVLAVWCYVRGKRRHTDAQRVRFSGVVGFQTNSKHL